MRREKTLEDSPGKYRQNYRQRQQTRRMEAEKGTIAPGMQGKEQRISQTLPAKTLIRKLEKFKSGVEVMSQGVKCLSLKLMSLSLIPKAHIVSVKQHACNPSSASKE